jgi:antirestriction protein ArdC
MLDKITMPRREQFDAPDKYYATLLHELGHSTGHHSRLNRPLGNKHGSPAYAKEELRAEIASYIMGGELDLGHDPSQHLAYVKSWVSILKDNPMEIMTATRDAEKISNYLVKDPLKREKEKQFSHETIKKHRPRFNVLNAQQKSENEVLR